MTDITTIEIAPAPRNVTGGGQRYEVRVDGEVLIERARDPEFEAARVLVEQGRTGMLHTRHAGSSIVSMRIPLAKAAKLTTTDGNHGRPSIRTWTPFEDRGQVRESEDA